MKLKEKLFVEWQQDRLTGAFVNPYSCKAAFEAGFEIAKRMALISVMYSITPEHQVKTILDRLQVDMYNMGNGEGLSRKYDDGDRASGLATVDNLERQGYLRDLLRRLNGKD